MGILRLAKHQRPLEYDRPIYSHGQDCRLESPVNELYCLVECSECIEHSFPCLYRDRKVGLVHVLELDKYTEFFALHTYEYAVTAGLAVLVIADTSLALGRAFPFSFWKCWRCHFLPFRVSGCCPSSV